MRRPPSRLVLLGHPVAHSLSPRLQNAALAHAGFTMEYVALDVAAADLADTLQKTLRHANAAGNVTIPHKAATYALCDRLTETAVAVGAVNTFWYDDEALVGDNTDLWGFNAAVESLIGPPLPGLRVTVLGAGGSASAVAAATHGWPQASLTIWNRTQAAADELAQRFDHARVDLDMARALADADLVVNATPIGLYDNTLPADLHLLPSSAAVLDLVYKPGKTHFVKAVRATGRSAADGLCMLIEQGALSFERWFEIAPDRRVMWGAIIQSATS